MSNIPPHQLRVLEELAQVSDRLKKLNTFIDGRSETFDRLPAAEQSRLREQATYMADYEGVLIRRVIAFS
ncbi:crAss001_48 related protein [Enterobacter hormaechei]|uniref:crAss001_48 related protein n=1 Tax=Enterobacter hormaechei TaxID=158836 RepID=UPI003CC767B3